MRLSFWTGHHQGWKDYSPFSAVPTQPCDNTEQERCGPCSFALRCLNPQQSTGPEGWGHSSLPSLCKETKMEGGRPGFLSLQILPFHLQSAPVFPQPDPSESLHPKARPVLGEAAGFQRTQAISRFSKKKPGFPTWRGSQIELEDSILFLKGYISKAQPKRQGVGLALQSK